ncbi:MAG: elongation factor P [Candidatus Levybacteria bacterium]|nr:elongation factor P [Candidatus Levybacteria bacterium]
MINVTDLRAGTIFEDEGQIFQVLSYEHIKMGRGSANIKVKVKNIKTGATTEKSFINGARVDSVNLYKKDMQFLYKDGDTCYFMDTVSFEQMEIPLPKLSGHVYLKEGMNFSISFLEGDPLSLALPPKMEFTVSAAAPSLRGNSATNIYKDAVLENGLKTKVPLFIKEGDTVRIDTRDGSYSEKV